MEKNLKTLEEQISEELETHKLLKEAWEGKRDTNDRLLEGEVDWINGSEWGELSEERKEVALKTLENIKEDIEARNPGLLSENNTASISTHDAILLPTWRMALAKVDAMDLVATLPMSGPEMSLYIERIGFGGKFSKQGTVNVKNLDRGDGTTPAQWARKLYYFDVSADESIYTNITIEDGVVNHGDFSSTGDVILGYVEHKELDVTGDIKMAKVLVRERVAQTLPTSGDVKLNGVATAKTILIVQDGALAIDFLLETYSDMLTTYNGETLNDFNTFQITLERVLITAGMHAVGFEYTTALVQDMQKQFKVDARQRLASACHYQLASSISKRLFNLLAASAEVVETWVYATAQGRHPAEKYSALMDKIRYERSRIGQKTHLSIANKMVMTLGVASLISGMNGWKDVDKATGGAGLMKIGSINSMDCYQITFNAPGTEFVLLTLRMAGNNQAAGAFYCPYIGISIVGSDANGISNYSNGLQSRIYFAERSALLKNPYDSSRYSTFFSVNLDNSPIV